MAVATTEEFDEMVFETSEDGTSWLKICGLLGVTVTRTANMDVTEVPDCDDESLPLAIERSVRSIEFSVSASDAVWSQEAHELLLDWFYNSERKRMRIGHTAAAIGDTEYESGFGYITSCVDTRTKGAKVTRALEFMFDGTPTRTAQTT